LGLRIAFLRGGLHRFKRVPGFSDGRHFKVQIKITFIPLKTSCEFQKQPDSPVNVFYQQPTEGEGAICHWLPSQNSAWLLESKRAGTPTEQGKGMIILPGIFAPCSRRDNEAQINFHFCYSAFKPWLAV
jgi:hypothetical protein